MYDNDQNQKRPNRAVELVKSGSKQALKSGAKKVAVKAGKGSRGGRSKRAWGYISSGWLAYIIGSYNNHSGGFVFWGVLLVCSRICYA